MTDGRPLAIVDIDGVVADVRHRLHHLDRRPKNWSAFFAAAVNDATHPEGLALLSRLVEDHDVVFLTGRPSHLERDTRKWLAEHGLGDHQLVMRPEGDRRPAATIKLEALERLARDAPISIVIDDDTVVIAAAARAGFATFHADWEQRDARADTALRVAQERDGRT